MSGPDYVAMSRRRPPTRRSLDELLLHILTHPSPVMWLLPADFMLCVAEASRSLHGDCFYVPAERIRCGHKTVRMARWPR